MRKVSVFYKERRDLKRQSVQGVERINKQFLHKETVRTYEKLTEMVTYFHQRWKRWMGR